MSKRYGGIWFDITDNGVDLVSEGDMVMLPDKNGNIVVETISRKENGICFNSRDIEEPIPMDRVVAYKYTIGDLEESAYVEED